MAMFVRTGVTSAELINIEEIVRLEEKPGSTGIAYMRDGSEVPLERCAWVRVCESNSHMPAQPGFELLRTDRDTREPIIAWHLMSHGVWPVTVKGCRDLMSGVFAIKYPDGQIDADLTGVIYRDEAEWRAAIEEIEADQPEAAE